MTRLTPEQMCEQRVRCYYGELHTEPGDILTEEDALGASVHAEQVPGVARDKALDTAFTVLDEYRKRR